MDFWVSHVRTQEIAQTPDKEVIRLLKEFFGSIHTSSAAYRNWAACRIPGLDFITHRMIKWQPSASVPFIMCTFGFYKLLLDWWSDPSLDLNATSDRGYPLLYLALFYEHPPIWQHLLKGGAIVNMELPGSGSPLTVATTVSVEAVHDLLEAGAEVNMPLRGHYGSALAVASASSTVNKSGIIELLLQKGADVNLPLQGHYGSALAAASLMGLQRNVQLLLQAKADINMPLQGNFGSALAAASCSSRRENIELLLQNGADVNMLLPGQYGSALAAASNMGSKEHVQLLLKANADVNMPLQGKFGNALVAASHSFRQENVSLLLEAGADVNMPLQGRYGSALAAALETSKPTMMIQYGPASIADLRRLLAAGANVNMPLQDDYGSVLARAAALAATTGRGTRLGLRFLSILLDAGADVDMELNGKYSNAMEAAAKGPNSAEVIRMLLSYSKKGGGNDGCAHHGQDRRKRGDSGDPRTMNVNKE